MKKYLGVALAAMFAVAIAAPAFAQNSGGQKAGSVQGADTFTVFKGLTASTNYFAVKYQCKDSLGTSSTIAAAIADCCIAGDIWRSTIWKGNSNSRFKNVANTSEFVAGAAAFAPDVYSPDGLIGGTKISGVYILATMGNQTPGGLPAGGTLRIVVNGTTVTCARKQFAGGSATS